MSDRILTTHTGSLPRPDALRALYVRRQSGEEVAEDELRRAGAEALRDVVGRQMAAGIDVGNDGEQTREGFFIYMLRRLTGFGGGWDRPLWADVERYPRFRQQREMERVGKQAVSARDLVPEAVGPVAYITNDPIEADCAAFNAILDDAGRPFVETFVTAPSPGILAKAMRNRYYDNERAYLAALGEALRVEYETIVREGFLLQIDAPDLALERHAAYKDQPLDNFLTFAETVVEAINEALRNIPRERVRIHACWGNYEGPHDCDVDLDKVLPILQQAKVGGFVLPFANGRHAQDFTAFRDNPLREDQYLVAGVIDTLTNVIEHPKVVADRLERIAVAIGNPERLLAGTDCGFDTAAGSGRCADDVVWAKLASLSEGARLASERLFGRALA